jgi:hypothetical protein
MLHEEPPPCTPSSPFGFLQFFSMSLKEADATAAGMSETPGE